MKWFFSEFHGHIIARAPDGTTYRVPDGDMNSALGITMLNAMARALSKPSEEARQAIDGIAELEQENRLMRARMDRLQLERDTIAKVLGHTSIKTTERYSHHQIDAQRTAMQKAFG